MDEDKSDGNHKEAPAMEENRTLYISGMTCHSCERIVSKAVESAGGRVHSVNAKGGTATVDYPQGALGKIREAIASSGYALLDPEGRIGEAEPFDQEIKSFARRLFSGEKGLWVERKLLKMSIASLIAIVFLGFFAYLLFFRNVPGFGPRLPFLLYAAISAVACTGVLAHFRAHKGQFTCMEGMMIGMTIGMMAGFLFGAIIGATNGMFTGSVFGMAIGMLMGAYCGKCCGIMGVMEGLMAGLMGGTMGAMLTVMMIADNLLLFMPLLVGSCLLIIAGLTYMIYTTAGKREERQLVPLSSFLLLSILLTAVTAIVMFIAPKGLTSI